MWKMFAEMMYIKKSANGNKSLSAGMATALIDGYHAKNDVFIIVFGRFIAYVQGRCATSKYSLNEMKIRQKFVIVD